MDQIVVFAVLALALLLFVWGRWRYDVVALAVLIILTVTNIVPASNAFSGFGHPAVVTVAAVLVIGKALQKSGIIEVLADRISRASRNPSGNVALLVGLVALCSSMMNNVAALTLLIPVAIHSAEANDRPVSQVLMPLSFGSLLGGLTTLMGTPPNVIIANYRAEIVGSSFRVFDFTPVGLGVLLVGLAYIALLGWRLIPQRRQHGTQSGRLFEISDYVSEARVPSDSPFVDRTLRDLDKEIEVEVTVLGLVRDGRRILAPRLSERLKADDCLILECDPASLQAIANEAKLDITGGEKVGREGLQSENVALVEAVVSPGSWLEDRPANPVSFRRGLGANLLAVSRRGRPVWRGVGDLRIRSGDVLLLQGETSSLPQTLRNLGCLPLAERDIVAVRRRPQLVPFGVFAAAIVLSVAGVLPVHIAFVTTAVLFVLLGLLSLREAYASIDWPVIVLIGALLPVGQALSDTGGTDVLARGILVAAGSFPPLTIVAILLMVSMLLSDVINNAAAAIVMAPIAGSTAGSLGINPDGLLMAVAVGCSCTFLTPIGHQSNTLVWGLGGYRFGDYWRMGLPLHLLVVASATVLIGVFWGL